VTETTAICRFCHATCGLKVTLKHGQVVSLIGDIENPMYHGYSCVKGRNYHEFHRDPGRVLHPLQRDDAGQLEEHEAVGAPGRRMGSRERGRWL